MSLKVTLTPSQFWRKQKYYPNGLMNTYND